MATAAVINWVESGLAFSISAITTGEAMPFNAAEIGTGTTYYSTNPFTSVTTGVFQMPMGNVRNIDISAGFDLTGIDFDIIGEDERGNALIETLAGANAPVFSVNKYYKVLSVIPNGTNGNLVTLSLGTSGYTFWYKVDVWNKASSYSMTYSHVDGAIEATPKFTQDDPMEYIIVAGVKRFKLNDEIAEFEVPVAELITVPSPFDIPAVANSSINFDMPIVALNTLVTDSTGSFKQTIVQQGGKY